MAVILKTSYYFEHLFLFKIVIMSKFAIPKFTKFEFTVKSRHISGMYEFVLANKKESIGEVLECVKDHCHCINFSFTFVNYKGRVLTTFFSKFEQLVTFLKDISTLKKLHEFMSL